jgi:hypothetical protein
MGLFFGMVSFLLKLATALHGSTLYIIIA